MKRLVIAALLAPVLTGCIPQNIARVPTIDYAQVEARDREHTRQLLMNMRASYNQDAAMTDVNIGCYKVWLLPTQSGAAAPACPAGELQAVTGTMNTRKDRRATYNACYKRDGDKAVIRWTNGVPKGMAAVTTVAIPPAGTPSRPVPGKCTAPTDPYNYVIIVNH